MIDPDTLHSQLFYRGILFRPEKGVNMEKLELTDLHNRRGNIELVSKRAKENDYPLLTWPEDKQLLRLVDLPVINKAPNVPPAWTRFRLESTFFVSSDANLREKIRIGCAYYRITPTQHLTGDLIVEGTFIKL